VRVAEMLGVRGTGSDAAAALRALPPATLVSTFAAWRSVIEGPPAPTIARSAVDGWAILDPIDQSLQRGTMHQVPILMGTSADEGTVAIRELPFGSVDEFRAALRRWYGDEDGALARAYPVEDPTSLLPTFQRLWGDEKYGAPARAFARLAAARGARVYFYFFTRVGAGMQARGAFHGSDVPFAFGQPTRDGSAGTTAYDDTLTQMMSDYWAAFVANGDPNGSGRPVWPPYEGTSGQYLELGSTIIASRGLRTEQWDAMDLVARSRGAIRP
jgi:para-nitrobenzyl esterase